MPNAEHGFRSVVDRRQFLKTAALGLAGLTMVPRVANAVELLGFETNSVDEFRLAIDEAMVQMVDETWVYMWTWTDEDEGQPRFPGPVLVVETGQVVEMRVHNTLDEPHSFSIPGVVDTGPIPPGERAEFNFVAPAPGIYPYLDALNAPVNRVLGLHGAFVVMPPANSLTPYTSPTPNVQRLFEDLGTTSHFPGDSWRHERMWVWVFSNIDPTFNARALAGITIEPADMDANFLGRYFTLNGKSGYFAAHDPTITLHGRIGEPALVRILNFGMHPHGPHAHGNHKYVIAKNGEVAENVRSVDVVHVRPLETLDFVFPFFRPPDIPPAAWPPQEEPFPWEYPMHCHLEPSQTAAGANYPQGLMTEIVFEGDATHVHGAGEVE